MGTEENKTHMGIVAPATSPQTVQEYKTLAAGVDLIMSELVRVHDALATLAGKVDRVSMQVAAAPAGKSKAPKPEGPSAETWQDTLRTFAKSETAQSMSKEGRLTFDYIVRDVLGMTGKKGNSLGRSLSLIMAGAGYVTVRSVKGAQYVTKADARQRGLL